MQRWLSGIQAIAKGGLVGPELITLIAFMKGACHASFSTIRTFLRDIVGVTISRGELAKILTKVSAWKRPIQPGGTIGSVGCELPARTDACADAGGPARCRAVRPLSAARRAGSGQPGRPVWLSIIEGRNPTKKTSCGRMADRDVPKR